MKLVDKEVSQVPACRKANKAEVAEFFGVSLPTVEAWVRRGCPILQKGRKGVSWQLDLLAVMQWKYMPEEGDGETDPEAMLPKDRKDWYEGEKRRRELQIQDGELYVAHEYDLAAARAFKAVAAGLETLPDILERDAGLEGHQLEPVFAAIDRMREQLHLSVAGDE